VEFSDINLWGSYIWKFTYEFDYDSLKPHIDNIFSHWSVSKEASLVESGDALSTVSVGVYDSAIQPHNLSVLDDYHQWLSSRIAFVWDKLEYNIHASEISKSWFNVHKKGGKTLEHAHNRTDLVVSSYVRCPAGSGNIEFRDPLEYHKLGFPVDLDNNLWREVPVKTNDVLFFPGWLNHRTQENTTDQERIVMTYNIDANPTL
jgi:uncharacterized protein (TIGR02466 family)